MPISRYSQSRRAHLEGKADAAHRKHFDKTEGDIPTQEKALKEEKRKKKRGDKKKR